MSVLDPQLEQGIKVWESEVFMPILSDITAEIVKIVANQHTLAITDQWRSLQNRSVIVKMNEDMSVNSHIEERGSTITIVVNRGLALFLNQIQRIVLSQVDGSDAPFPVRISPDYASFAALNLARSYFRPNDHEYNPIALSFIPPNHPYSRVAGAILVGEIAFVVCHEIAHYLLGHLTETPRVIAHGRDVGVMMSYTDAQTFLEQEVAADKLSHPLTIQYLEHHEDDYIRLMGIIGPPMLFYWLAYCETVVGSTWLNEWLDEVARVDAAARNIEKDENIFYSHFHMHPLGSERADQFLSLINLDDYEEFSAAIIMVTKDLVGRLMADAKKNTNR